MWKFLAYAVAFWRVFEQHRCQFLRCHDDPGYRPREGPLEDFVFTWLGTLQYIHIKNGTPHYFRAPRVVLISRQYVLSTAKDAYEVPDGFALGNIAFGEYERDDAECGLTVEMVESGTECDPGAAIVPVADVLVHPEYMHYEVKDSVAVMKMIVPLKSRLMVPVCLPFKNYLKINNVKLVKNMIYLVDYTNIVPRDVMQEDKELNMLSLLPEELCLLPKAIKVNESDTEQDKFICTTGCGFNLGAAIVIQEYTGHFTLVALSLGGSPCPDPLRSAPRSPPARHLALYPYVDWITAAVTGQPTRRQYSSLPSAEDVFGFDWNGHWWLGGLPCFHRGDAAHGMFKFYHEVFRLRQPGHFHMTYYLALTAAHGTDIVCIKIGLPHQLLKPTVWGLESAEVKIRIPVVTSEKVYKFQVEAFAVNVTTKEKKIQEKEEEEDDDDLIKDRNDEANKPLTT